MKNKYALLFSFLISVCFAQKPDVVLTTGHTDQVNYIDLNHDGTILATGGNDKLIKLWDVATGKEIRTFAGNDGRINYVKFSPDGKYIGAVLYSNQLKFWEVKTGKLIRTIENSSTYDVFDYYPTSESVIFQTDGSKVQINNFVNGTVDKEFEIEYATRLRVHPDNKRAMVYTVKGEIKSYSLPEGQELGKLSIYSGENVPQVSTKLEISRDGKYLAAAFYNNTIHIIDIASNKEYAVFKDHPKENNIIHDLKFKETENKLISVDGQKNIFVFDIASKKKILSVNNTMFGSICVEVHPKQDYFLVNDMKKVNYCKFSTGEIVKEYVNKANRLLNMSYDQQGKYLATAGDDISIKLWNLKENKIEKTIPGFFPLIFTNDGKKLITMGSTIGLVMWDPETGEKLMDLNTEFELIQNLSVSADGKYLSGGGFMGALKVWDLETGKMIKKLTGHVGGIYGTAFSPDGKYLASCGMDQTVRIWDFSTGKEIKKLEGHTIIVSDVQFSKDGKWLVSSAWDKTIKIWNTQDWSLNKTLEGHVNIVLDIDISDDGKYIASASGNNVVSPADNSVRIWEMATGKQVCKLDNPTGQLNRVIFEKGSDILYTCGEDGIAKVWNYKDCKEIAGMIAANGTDYMMYTPDNYYICSKGALDAVSFRVDDLIYPFEQFDIKLNRPDIVAQRIGKTPQNLINAYTYVYKKRLKKMNFTEEQLSADFHLPKVSLVTQNIPLITKENKLKFKINAYDDKYRIDRIQVYIDNVPVFGMNGIDLKKYNSGNIDYEIETGLIVGNNKIQFSCINEKGVESLSETFKLVRESGELTNGNLYVITIGASEYKDSRYNLKYAAKDAEDVMNKLITTKDLYKNVYSKTLKNADVTKENIAALNDFLKNTGTDDAVIVFVAGHGVLDDKLDYYYCTYDMNFEKPSERGIAYEELENLFNGLKALKKLLFMDTCHSGELDKDEVQKKKTAGVEVGGVSFRAVGEGVENKNAFGFENSVHLTENLFSNIKKGTGTTVISSAGGVEYAMESDQWKNGLFTYCLLNGLTNKFADANKNGQIVVTEVQKYVADEVKKLSKGRQKPTARSENLELDYRLW
jgi:WD40 repeat protein/uncharacterized caspase-like protein